MRVRWTKNAQKHLLAIFEHIEKDSALYARRMVDRLTSRSKQIGKFPYSGRSVPEYQAPDIREIVEPPYRLIYRIKPDQVDILAVAHGAQLLPPEPRL